MIDVQIILVEKNSVECIGKHIHTIPGHRHPTKEELADYYGIKNPKDKRFPTAHRIAGYHRYVVRPKGGNQYIIFPMNGVFRMVIMQ